MNYDLSNGDQRGLQSVAFHPDFGNVGTLGYGKLYTTMLEARPANPANPAFKYLGNSNYVAPSTPTTTTILHLRTWTASWLNGRTTSMQFR